MAMQRRHLVVSCLLWMLTATASAQTTLEQDLFALESLRNGDKTNLDAVDQQGAALLEKYEKAADQAQIYYRLAHVHAQSGLKQPGQIVNYARKALDSKLLTPEQRGMLYSYLSSAHEVDPAVKDFAERRRRAVAPLLEGLAELAPFGLPAVAPELPAVPIIRIEGENPAEQARRRQQSEDAQRARRDAERVRDLVHRKETLCNQVKWLYYRDPIADDELRQLALKAVGEGLAEKLVAAAKAERERIEKARAERQRIEKSKAEGGAKPQTPPNP